MTVALVLLALAVAFLALALWKGSVRYLGLAAALLAASWFADGMSTLATPFAQVTAALERAGARQ